MSRISSELRQWRLSHALARKALERVLFAIEIHGPEAVFDHLGLVRALWRGGDADAFGQVRAALVERGMPHHEVMDLICLVRDHGADCACWKCVMRLHNQIFIRLCAEQAKMLNGQPVGETQ